MKTYEETVKELDAKIPREVIRSREAGNGRSVDYLSGYYVIDRLNKTLGQGKWSYDIDGMNLVGTHTLKLKDRLGKEYDVHTAHYVATIRFTGEINGVRFSFTDVGYGDGQDKANPGKAHELASKEAVTDGLKRCAKNLGQSMGLALYDKEQSNVEEDKPKPVAESAVKVSTGSPKKELETEQALKHKEKEIELGLINSASKVLIKAEIRTIDQLKDELLTKYGVKAKEELSLEKAREFKNHLLQLTKQPKGAQA